MPNLTIQDRIAGGLWGLLVGDAVGVPYEFQYPEALPPVEAIDIIPPLGFHRSHQGVPVGTWSDDGAHALCLLASLLYCGRLDINDLMRRLINWYDVGYMTPDGVVFDVGVQTTMAFATFRRGVQAVACGPAAAQRNGNGSLMRVLPLALWHQGSDVQLINDAHLQSRITHGHMRAQVCCALYCMWARYTLQGIPMSWKAAVETLRSVYAEESEEREELELHIRPDEAPRGTGSGYVVDCLQSARVALEQKTYQDVVQTAIKLGRDTDTTACVAGGIAGLREGIEAIPARWMTTMQGDDIVTPLLTQLLTRHG